MIARRRKALQFVRRLPSGVHKKFERPLPRVRASDEICPPRMIHTVSLKLIEVSSNSPDTPTPQYAILSHRWNSRAGQEISYEEFLQSPRSRATKRKIGYQKILLGCKQARIDKLDYLWVDTCCIDQEDIGDVHQNIKSMFAYYQHSCVCYAYLADVDSDAELNDELTEYGTCHQPDTMIPKKVIDHEPPSLEFKHFKKSEWHRRGWTLQELLAPKEVFFFDQSWKYLGTRSVRAREIQSATGIPEDVIQGKTCIHDVNVKERMSWSTLRVTSKAPDQAYCLFGILGVTIEPDYSEDVKTAFNRLREAYIKQYPDKAIIEFGWHVYGGDIFSNLLKQISQRHVQGGPVKKVDLHELDANEWTE
ncbi:HET-domain-containing protein [Dendrothele bispora CBS 962.96]|uniref:HET-domain-containing protein n=1 Tax=Dendrothele bispora (strain CBS 962.96) TaxID=1314807 RepID=A0A4S8L5B1_DENBC|nr:HET-domain-containing protein [Dendrothele bispora CBS 962.96]